jgi:hypothetical protein
VNLRLYRTSWIVAGVGLIVALLTLQSPQELPQPALPTAFDTGSALDFSREVEAVSRRRPAGGPADETAADLIRRQLLAVPGARREGPQERVREQEFTARDAGGRLIRMRNVFLALPATESGVRGGILVVAPRDTPTGVAAGASSSGIMLQLARFSATILRRRPIIFVSTDGSSVGNAGIRWFLSRFSDFSLAAGVVIDAAGEGEGEDLYVWTHGGGITSSLDLIPSIQRAAERAGGGVRVETGALSQLSVGALPQSFGDQAPLVEAGIPSFALSNRPDSPLRDDFGPSSERVALAGTTATELLGALDAADSIREPDASYWLNGRVLRPQPLRAVALLLLLPALVMAADAWARLRRAPGRIGGGLRGVLNRVAVIGAAAIAAHVASLLGAFAGTAAGVPPLPIDVELGPGAVLGVALALLVGGLTFLALRRGGGETDPESEVGAALAVLALLMVALWFVNPFAALIAAPAAHAAALASRPWPPGVAVGLVLMLLVGPLLLIGGLSPRLDEGFFFSVWYLFETTVSGARGILIPALVVGIVACLWSIGEPVARGWQPRSAKSRRRRPPQRRRRAPRIAPR